MSHDTWILHVGEGRILLYLVKRYVEDLEPLLPSVESDDPLAQLDAEIQAGAKSGETIVRDPELLRLFPPALADPMDAARFRRDAVATQARTRLEAARKVLDYIGDGGNSQLVVATEDVDAWVSVLAAIRAQWHVELTGTADRLAQPTEMDIREDPETAAILDWLALMIEEALHAERRRDEQ